MKVHELFRIMNYNTPVVVITDGSCPGYSGVLDVIPFEVYAPVRNMDVTAISYLNECIRVDVRAEDKS